MDTDPDPEISAFNEVLRRVSQACSLPLKNYKRAFIRRRVDACMLDRGIRSYSGYLAYLIAHPEEAGRIHDAITITVTRFFRDGAFFAHMKGVLKDLLGTRDRVRIWCAGAATGEEAYSMVVLASEVLGAAHRRGVPGDLSRRLSVLATDIDENALTHARKGIYSREALQDVPEGTVARYFQPAGDRFRISSDIRSCVRFVRHDLLSDDCPEHFDMVLCRNVLIYMNRDDSRRVLGRMHASLRRGGLLVLGMSEVIHHEMHDLFEIVSSEFKIFRRKEST